MATDIPSGRKARITWRFKKADGSDGKVDGDPTVMTTLGAVEETKAVGDGSYTALISSTQAGAASVTVMADVDLGQGDDAKSEVTFALADLNFLPEGRTESVADVVIAVE